MNQLLKYGLIGKRLDYSFSKNYFTRKFEQEGIHAEYKNLAIESLDAIREIISQNQLSGFNVTIPYKEKIFDYLDDVSETARTIGAVNCVQIMPDDYWVGHNTDCIGFELSLLTLLDRARPKAMIFGSGGTSQAVKFVLQQLGIDYISVSRHDYLDYVLYEQLNEEYMQEYKLLINTTPLGTFPDIDSCVDIPYEFISPEHFCFDVVYNPDKSKFLTLAQDKSAKIKNGQAMLELQADESWKIWTKEG